MSDTNALSQQQLLERVARQSRELASRDKELAQHKDMLRQLEEQKRQLEKDYLKLFRERFGRKSERYIADPDQLRIDFGDTDDASDDASDAADGLHKAVEEADLIPAHLRRKPRKKSNALPAHFPRVEPNSLSASVGYEGTNSQSPFRLQRKLNAQEGYCENPWCFRCSVCSQRKD